MNCRFSNQLWFWVAQTQQNIKSDTIVKTQRTICIELSITDNKGELTFRSLSSIVGQL